MAGPALHIKYIRGSAIGFAAGMTLGCCGWGGAQIIVPSLTTRTMGYSQVAAASTSITSLSCASTVAASGFFLAGSADMYTAACIAVPSMLGARVGVALSNRLSQEALGLIFNGMSCLLIPTHFAVQQWRERHPHAVTEGALERAGRLIRPTEHADWATAEPNLSAAPRHACFGVLSGVLSALMGVGGAPLTMSYLTVATDTPHHLVQGTTMLAVLPAVVTSAVSHALAGHTPMALAASVCCGSMAGTAAGTLTRIGASPSSGYSSVLDDHR